jgi:hypothetical protein
MDLFHKLIELIDKNSSTIPEGDYIELCDTMKQLRDKVKPPSFLLDQNDPMTLGDEDEEVMYPGLNDDLQELDEEWTEHVEPGAYYPPQTETTSTVEVSLSE